MARRIKYYSPKRRAIYAKGENIDHLAVFQRDKWICQICHNKIDKRLRKPSWWCATIDHKVPISVALAEGWPVEKIHSYDNVQAAHLKCNLSKGSQSDLTA